LLLALHLRHDFNLRRRSSFRLFRLPGLKVQAVAKVQRPVVQVHFRFVRVQRLASV